VAFNAGQWVGFTVGVAVMFAGLGLLTPNPGDEVGKNPNNRRMSRGASANFVVSEDELDADLPEFTSPKPSLMEFGAQLKPVPGEILSETVRRLSMMPQQLEGTITKLGEFASNTGSTATAAATGGRNSPPIAPSTPTTEEREMAAAVSGRNVKLEEQERAKEVEMGGVTDM
jgi:hypothetical protein